jgi:phenylpyruvate tautomerase PptA (4-oxalocrotonate tautomerase family)
MPLARIDLIQGKPAAYRAAIGEVVYQAIIHVLKAPKNDRFAVINEHPPENFIADPTYLGIARSPDCVFIQVTLNEGRTVEVKRAFYRAIADGLHEKIGLRREDVLINLVEVKKENWSFGNGEAPYAPPPG